MAIKIGVSLYSLQEQYFLGKLDLEGCISAVAAAGATGIELIPEQMPVGSYPNPTDSDVARWFGLMDKYCVEPTCMDIYDDWKLYQNRALRPAECLESLINYFKLANRLGFKLVRAQAYTYPIEVIEAAIPYAEELNVSMGFENHAPRMIRSPRNEEFIDLIDRTGTQHVGILIDFGVFEKKANPLMLAKYVRQGMPQEIADYISDAFDRRAPLEETKEYLAKINAPQIAEFVATSMVYHYNDPEDLRAIRKYLSPHCHAKFYDVKDDLTESLVDYDGALRVLSEMGWNGYLSSEFEGQRFFHDIESGNIEIDEVEQVRRHIKMTKNLLAKYAQ